MDELEVAIGELIEATLVEWATKRPWGQEKTLSPLQKAGIRYENRVKRWLEEDNYFFLHNPILRWRGHSEAVPSWRYCVPDFVLIGRQGDRFQKAIILECKLSKKEDSEEKLRRIYMPLLRSLLRQEVVGLVACARWSGEEEKNLISALEDLADKEPNSIHWALWPDKKIKPW